MKLMFSLLLAAFSCGAVMSGEVRFEGPNKENLCSSSYQQKVLDSDPKEGIVEVYKKGPQSVTVGNQKVDFSKTLLPQELPPFKGGQDPNSLALVPIWNAENTKEKFPPKKGTNPSQKGSLTFMITVLSPGGNSDLDWQKLLSLIPEEVLRDFLGDEAFLLPTDK